MTKKIQTLINVARNQGSLQAVLAVAEATLPSPYAERSAFTRDFANQISEAPSDWSERFEMWRDGFLPKSYYLYNFDEYSSRSYLTDIHEEHAWNINGLSQKHVNDKRKFHHLLSDRGYKEYLPEYFGDLFQGVLIGSGSDIFSLLDMKGELVIKGHTGAAGKKVYIIKFDGVDYYFNGKPLSKVKLRNYLSSLDGYMVTELCKQSKYISEIYPHTPNTIRMITMNPQDDDPFIARAVHRIGTNRSESVDNFTQGGLSAEVGRSGELGSAVRYSDTTVSWHSSHPDTGAQIQGVIVPQWESICETILSASSDIPELRYLGWDIIVTEKDGFKIIEANANSDTDLIQVHEPLLRDSQVRDFYRTQEVI
ncbi:sugar-transfer associated ATP-grasp domain-containing protein [Natronococcus amylolyticus]|uniref:sugar-transfer associated ATP-grasp domain-containing protein n=1 Tax=Natronococcus amylolyticus TaxID=44470 RepID=UPI001360B4F7|nr:sugar-transfer associated ATP-grasp domain-containing protein [Natronococcus amylolyticus]